MCERDSCGEHRCEPREVAGDAGDAGAGDQEGEEGQGRALGGEGEKSAEDWVLLIMRDCNLEDRLSKLLNICRAKGD